VKSRILDTGTPPAVERRFLQAGMLRQRLQLHSVVAEETIPCSLWIFRSLKMKPTARGILLLEEGETEKLRLEVRLDLSLEPFYNSAKGTVIINLGYAVNSSDHRGL
jgi:hypothetical protein